MSSIAEQANLIPIKPWRAPNGHERSCRILAEIFKQSRHEREGVGELFVEEAEDIRVGLCRGKAARALEFPKERAGERAVGVRQCDHHETLSRPDVERVLLHAPRTIWPGRNGQFFVAVGEITLVILKIVDLKLH